jgi:phosphatidate cytidylyltransferase
MSETTRRILSAAILVPLFLFSFYYSGWYYIQLFVFCCIPIYLGIKEFYSFSNREDEGKPFQKTGFFYGILMYLVAYLQFIQTQTHNPLPRDISLTLSKIIPPDINILFPILFLLFVHVYLLQILTRPLEGAIFSTSSTIAGVIYLVIPNVYFLKVIALERGIYYIWIVAGLTFLTDAGAYFGGRWFGRHPAGLKISPKKTWEGYITGIITALVYTFSVTYFWRPVTGQDPGFSYFELLLFTPLFSLISVIGDLAESAMKRDARVKDSASVIPGHGGLLDLGDAIFFTMPCAYFYLSLKLHLGFTI